MIRNLAVRDGPSLCCPAPMIVAEVIWPAGADGLTAQTLAWLRDAIVQLAARHKAPESAPALAAAAPPQSRLLEQSAETIALSLQTLAGYPAPDVTVDAGLLPAGTIGVAYRDRDVGLSSVRAAVSLLEAAIASGPVGPAGRIESNCAAIVQSFFRLMRATGLTESTNELIHVAEARRIPWQRLVPGERILQLGLGCKQQRLLGSSTSATGNIATVVSTHKHLATQIFRANGIPAPANVVVESAAAAVKAAERLGYPVVIKPVSTDFGTGVSVNVSDEAGVRRAFEFAARHGHTLVEQQIAGDHYRLLVVHGKFISAVRQEPAHVVGDGVSSVRQLIDMTNRGRTEELSSRLKKIKIDDEALYVLDRQQLSLDAVPPAGVKVRLREHSNTSVGGTVENVTARVHPNNRALAERAAAMIGLDVAGVDFITPDISRSYRQAGGAICEINPTPGLYMREPDYFLQEALLDGLFPGGDNGRIPIVCVLGEADDGRLLRTIEQAATAAGHVVARATHLGVTVGGTPTVVAELSPTQAGRVALFDPAASFAVIAMTYDGLIGECLPFDVCDLAVIMPSAVAGNAGAADDGRDLRRRAADLLAAHAARVVDGRDTTLVRNAVAALKRVAR